MLKVGQKLEVLRMFFLDGTSQRKISKELQLSRNTVRKYIDDFARNKRDLMEAGISKFELIENMTEVPSYNSSGRKATVLTDEVKEILLTYIKENECKKQNGNSKMRMTAADMHEELIEQGYKISYPTVSQYVQKHKENQTVYETFIKQIYQNGKVCEFDWGEVKLQIAGSEVKFKQAVFTLAKSNYRCAYLYRQENTQCFVDAHIRFFAYLGGIPEVLVYDNMKVAVARFVGRTEREATEALKKLSLYYGFSYRFCNIRRGNEKGHVENSVDFIRRKAFSAKNCFPSLEAAQERLKQRVTKHNHIKTKAASGQSPAERFLEEKPYLLPLVPAYTNCEVLTATVDKLSTISYQQNRYSVPDHLVKKQVTLRIYVEKLEILRNGTLLATHKRLWGNHEWSVDIVHYRKTLLQKPGALLGSAAFDQMHEALKEIFQNYFKTDSRSFIALLSLVNQYGIRPVQKSIQQLAAQKIAVSFDHIKLLLTRKQDVLQGAHTHKSPMQMEIEDTARKHLSQYDQIVGTSGIKEVRTL